MNNNEIFKFVDHTKLAATSTIDEIRTLCDEAIKYNTASVCIPPCYVEIAKKEFPSLNICTVIGFPLGYCTTETKVFETKNAIKLGATEIDMVINQSWAKTNNWKKVEKEIAAIKKACKNITLKVILETCNLTDKQIVSACKASIAGGAQFVKTSTGFGKGGATVEAVKLMAETVHCHCLKVKASGGVHNYEEALAMVQAGADRIGASCGVAICKE